MKIKSLILQALIVSLLPVNVCAQKNVSIDWYGFVAAQSWINTHESVASADGFLYLYPKDKLGAPMGVIDDGHDRNAVPQGSWFGTMARLGFVLKGPEVFGASSRAKAELEFSGHTAPGSILYRHAFMALDWENSTLTLGQTWHPMNDLFPSTVGIAIGAPFNPLNRSPQLRYEYFMGSDKNIKLMGAAIFQAANTSIGPDGKTYNYIRRSMMPMLYAGVDFTFGDFKVGGGVEYQRISPRVDLADNNKKYYMNGVSGMLQAQYNKDKLAIKAKTLVGQNMTHLGLCSGFARTTGPDNKYVPFTAWSSWAQVQYGGTLKFGLFGGYMENWGANGESLSAIYAVENGDLNGMWRISPNVNYYVGNMVLGFEYELTSVNYMDELQPGVETRGSHDVNNHRLLFSVMYSF